MDTRILRNIFSDLNLKEYERVDFKKFSLRIVFFCHAHSYIVIYLCIVLMEYFSDLDFWAYFMVVVSMEYFIFWHIFGHGFLGQYFGTCSFWNIFDIFFGILNFFWYWFLDWKLYFFSTICPIFFLLLLLNI